jgi:hypothetical protein
VLCADPLMVGVELLQHMPVHMARCSKLLLLVSPTITDSLRVVTELYTWRASGGQLAGVECVLVAPQGASADERQKRWQATIAAFDAFHVAYSRSKQKDEAERMTHAIQLATVPHFNEVIRSFVQPVQRAAKNELDNSELSGHSGDLSND